VGLSTTKKKKNVLQTNEQEQNPTEVAGWKEIFFKKKKLTGLSH
jgi:hypothetical protein